MSWRGTLFLLILAILAVGLLFFSGRSRTRSAGESLLGIEPSTIDQIKIQQRGSAFSLLKENSLWMIRGTTTDRANPKLVQALLQTAADITPLNILKPRDLKEAISLSSLDLKQPSRSLTFNDHTDHTIFLGTDGPAKGQLYARLNHGKDVYLISSDIAPLAFRSIEEYRDPSLTALSPDQLAEITLSRGTGMQEIRLKKSSQDWNLESPLSAPAEETALSLWIKSLFNAEITRWMPDGSDQMQYGMDTPSAVITLRKENESLPLVITIGAAVTEVPGSYYVRISDRPGICVVPGLIPFLSVTPQFLRSKELTRVEFDTIDRIEINGYQIERKPGSDDWQGHETGASQRDSIPASNVKAWFDQLQSLQANSFEAATPEHLSQRGLDREQPDLRIRFIAKLSENTAQENAGESVLASYFIGTPTNDEVALREGDSAELMILPASALDCIRNLLREAEMVKKN